MTRIVDLDSVRRSRFARSGLCARSTLQQGRFTRTVVADEPEISRCAIRTKRRAGHAPSEVLRDPESESLAGVFSKARSSFQRNVSACFCRKPHPPTGLKARHRSYRNRRCLGRPNPSCIVVRTAGTPDTFACRFIVRRRNVPEQSVTYRARLVPNSVGPPPSALLSTQATTGDTQMPRTSGVLQHEFEGADYLSQTLPAACESVNGRGALFYNALK